MFGKFEKFVRLLQQLSQSDIRADEIKINQGRLLADVNSRKTSSDVRDYEFKVFSQWGEDGILQFLISRLNIKNRSFIEFGVEDFSEANCRFLMMKDNWRGFVIDGSSRNIERLRSSYFFWRHDLACQAAFITRENISGLLANSGLSKEFGILSVDIDGNDYHVLEALSEWRPDILVVEYNAAFGYDRAVSVPYDPNFDRGQKHFSNLYWGASLPAFVYLAGQRGYAFVGTNSVASNAFFVRRELLRDTVKEVSLEAFMVPASFRESRSKDGHLSYLTPVDRRRLLRDMPLVDVCSGVLLSVGDLP